MVDQLGTAGAKIQEQPVEVANAGALVTPVGPAPHHPMVPPLHTVPVTSDQIREDYQKLVEAGEQLPEGPLRTAHGKLMDAIRPVYERAAENAEFREGLESEGRETAAELFNNVRAETIKLVSDLKAEASRGANGFLQWINDRIGDVKNAVTAFQTVVEEKIPEMNGRAPEVPPDTAGVDPGMTTPPLNEEPVTGMESKPIPNLNEDLTMETTGGVPIEHRSVGEHVYNITPVDKRQLRTFLALNRIHAQHPEGVVTDLNLVRTNMERGGVTAEQIENIVNSTMSEPDKLDQIYHLIPDISVPVYEGVSLDIFNFINGRDPETDASIPASTTLNGYIGGLAVRNYIATANPTGSVFRTNLAALDLSGIFLPSGTTLQGVDFGNANLDSAILSGVEFINPDFYNATLVGAQLQGSLISDGQLEGANFSNANLTAARFVKTNLSEAVFSGANLTSTRFYSLLLSGADFRPILGESGITQTITEGATFEEVQGLSDTYTLGTNLDFGIK